MNMIISVLVLNQKCNLQIACSQHFSMEPLSIILKGFFLEEDRQVGFPYSVLIVWRLPFQKPISHFFLV